MKHTFRTRLISIGLALVGCIGAALYLAAPAIAPFASYPDLVSPLAWSGSPSWQVIALAALAVIVMLTSKTAATKWRSHTMARNRRRIDDPPEFATAF